MRIVLIGAGGVGSAVVSIATRRGFFDALVIADQDPGKAERAVGSDPRVSAAQVDASDSGAVQRLARRHRATHVVNACLLYTSPSPRD